MKNFRLISEIYEGAWLMNSTGAAAFLPAVSNFLKNESVNFDSKNRVVANDPHTEQDFNKESQMQIFVIGASGAGIEYHKGSIESAPEQSFAIVPIYGAIMKADYCGDAGSMTNANRIKQANANPNIAGIFLKIDSPGGSVNGTKSLADAIAACTKPVYAYVEDGSCCSAAYWIASASNKVFASQQLDCVGSIGVYCTFMDYKPYFEEQGVKIHEIYAPQSTEKNKAYKEALENKYEGMKARLSTIAENFINEVKANRGAALKVGADHKAFKGADFFAPEALEIGLIDGICSFEECVAAMLDELDPNAISF